MKRRRGWNWQPSTVRTASSISLQMSDFVSVLSELAWIDAKLPVATLPVPVVAVVPPVCPAVFDAEAPPMTWMSLTPRRCPST